MSKTIRIGTRDSELALWQANTVKSKLEALGYQTELLPVKSTGDLNLDQPLYEMGITGIFTKTLDVAMVKDQIDIAVHSMKDVVVDLPENLVLPVIMKREDSRDVLISNHYNEINTIPNNSVVGTSSLRRQSQFRRLCPNAVLKDLRGNVGTRIRKLDDGEYDAILLAAAGIIRLGLSNRITQLVPHGHLLPAVGQGAIGIECRADDMTTQELIAPLNDKDTSLCVLTERAFSRRLNGGCQLPIAAHALIEDKQIKLSGLVAKLDGSEIIKSEKQGDITDIESIGNSLAELLLERGADVILKELTN